MNRKGIDELRRQSQIWITDKETKPTDVKSQALSIFGPNG
jgi:hypothetical protein